MKVDKSNSWKEKIDPAFDDLIKVQLDYIKLTHICSTDTHKRYLSLDGEAIKVLEHKGYQPLLKEFKPKPKNLKEKVYSFSHRRQDCKEEYSLNETVWTCPHILTHKYIHIFVLNADAYCFSMQI